MNAKYGSLFDTQSNYSKQDTEIKRNTSESESEQKNDRSHTNRTFQNKSHVNKTNESENTTSRQSEISTAKTSSNSRGEEDIEKMNRGNLYQWQPGKSWKLQEEEEEVTKAPKHGRKERSTSKARNYAETVRSQSINHRG